MNVPEGRTVRSRVVDDPTAALEVALDRGLTGYAVFEPQRAMLLDTGVALVVVVDDGVPVLAYERERDRGGVAALETAGRPGPYRIELTAVDDEAVAALRRRATDRFGVPPGRPAALLGRRDGADDLVRRTRAAAPDGATEAGQGRTALDEFLADEERIAAVRERAREEARARAAEWGLDHRLVGGESESESGSESEDTAGGE